MVIISGSFSVRAALDTQPRLPYNPNAPRKAKKIPNSNSFLPPPLPPPPSPRISISVDDLLKRPASKELSEEVDDSYMGYETWSPSPPKLEKPRSVFNAASLAFIGDSIYELYARRHFLFPPLSIEDYNDRVRAVVRCEAQYALLKKLVDDDFLTKEERDVLRWGKNLGSARTRSRRRAGVAVYNKASSLETLESVGTEAIKPERMFFYLSEYKKQIKLGTRCFIVEAIKTFDKLKPKLSNGERNWFEEHPQFRHFFHMKREKYHKVQGMWMLLLRTCEITRRREVWFIVNGVPIRYGLREHALLSGLNCHNYPLGYKERGGTAFVNRHFKEGELIRLEDVKAKLVGMGPHKDRLKMAVLYFLGSVICAQTKVNKGAKNVLEFFQRAVDDLEFCRTFPWGRFSYDYMLKEISHTIDHFGGLVKEKSLWPLPGFCVPLELLAFEAIPKLGKRYREPVEGADIKCPRMCRWAFKPIGMRGMPLSDIYDEMSNDTDIDSIIPTKTAEENCLLDDIFEEDDDVDESDIAVESWEKRLGEGYRVFFKDMFEEDLAAREKEVEPIEEAEQVAPQLTEAREVSNISKMMKMMNKMVKQLERVEKKFDKFDTRLKTVEDIVKELQKGKKKK